MPIDACGFRTLRAAGVQNPRHDAGRNRRPGSRKRPTPDGDASVPPNAGPRADCGHGDAVAARRSTALAQPTASAARWSWGRRLLARRSNRCENWWHGCPLRRLAQTSGSRSRDRHGVIGKWRIDPLPRCPPSRQVRPPALDFHKGRTGAEPIACPRPLGRRQFRVSRGSTRARPFRKRSWAGLVREGNHLA
jgi:hypothetical protein